METNQPFTEVIIFTESYRIMGKIAHYPDMRLTDYLNEAKRFIAVKDGEVSSYDQSRHFRADFFNVNRDKVELVVPAEKYESGD